MPAFLNVATYLFDAFFFLRAMKTSIDSLKLAVSWKGSQIPGAKFTVKVCVHSVLRLEGGNILFILLFILSILGSYITSVPIHNLCFAKGVDFTLRLPAYKLFAYLS